MPTIDQLLTNDAVRGVAIGVGVTTAAALLLPAVRPIARTVMKTGLVCFERSREWAVEAGEKFEDLVAEVKADLTAQRLGADAAGEAAQANLKTSGPSD